MPKAYFIGIAGKAPSSIAKALKEFGWEVSGSEHSAPYPPASTYLERNNIPYFKGYRKEQVPADADLVILGRGALINEAENEEYLKAKELNLNIISMPEALEKFEIKKESIVVVGTYGKTTTTGIIAWIFIQAGLSPSFMIGGEPLNFEDGVRITDSEYSITEGDEAPALFETDLPKFMFYHPKYLVLTATKWDHPEVYKSHKDYLAVFKKLVSNLPKDGLVIYNLDNVDQEIVDSIKVKKVSYSLYNSKADYFVQNTNLQGEKTRFEVVGFKNKIDLETTLIGKPNLENICGAVALADQFNIKQEIISQSVASFKGIKVRLELIGKFSNRYFYSDYAQHPEKVKGSLEALREHYKANRIFCIFDPVASALKYKESLQWYPEAFDSADRVVVTKVTFLKELRGADRVSGNDIVRAIKMSQPNVFYQPIDEKILEYLKTETKEEDVVIFMSSGGLRFTNFIEKTVDSFR